MEPTKIAPAERASPLGEADLVAASLETMETLELLKEFVKKHVQHPPESISLESKLVDIGIDSLNLLELIFEAEEKFGIRFSNDLPQPETVGQLIEIFEKLRATKT